MHYVGSAALEIIAAALLTTHREALLEAADVTKAEAERCKIMSRTVLTANRSWEFEQREKGVLYVETLLRALIPEMKS